MSHDIHSPSNVLPPDSAGSLPVARVFEHELRHLRSEWWWFLVLGILLIVSGMVALAYPALSSVAVVLVLGMSLVVSGVAMIVATFWAGRWSAHLLQLLIGVFYVVVGFLMMDKPLEATETVTLVVAAMFIVVGVMRSVAALVLRYPQWGWSLLSGVLSTFIGLVIYKSFPVTALWAIGTLVGIQLIFDGWYWVMLGVALRQLPAGRA